MRASASASNVPTYAAVAGVDRHRELLVELADQRLEVALARLALAAGQVEALAAGVAGHEQAALVAGGSTRSCR